MAVLIVARENIKVKVIILSKKNISILFVYIQHNAYDSGRVPTLFVR